MNSNRKTILLATWGLFTGLTLLMISAGSFSTLVGIRAELENLPTIISGGITTAYYAGFLIGSWYSLRALKSVGHIRVYAALASLLSASIIATGLFESPIIWIIMRVGTGFCLAGLYVVAESWLNGMAENHYRGRLLAIYNVVTIGAWGLGQLLVFNFDARNLSGFAFAAIVASLAVIPISISEQAATPEIENHLHLTMRDLARIVPTGAGTILLVGLAHGGMLGIAVIHATREGLGIGRIGILIAALQLGGMILTWSVSSASDDIDRRIIGLLCCLAVITLGGVMISQPTNGNWMILLLCLVGGFSFPLYAIGGAYTNDWVSPEQMGAAASQLVTLYGFGAMIGPLVAAPFLDVLGTTGFAWSIISLHTLILMFLIYRIRAWHAPVTTKHWDDVSIHGRAFFIPATIVSLGVNRRGQSKRQRQQTATQRQQQ